MKYGNSTNVCIAYW